MIVELHLLQNFAPANLNRDETGAPKECTFGGVRRARISSQAFKRAIRTVFSQEIPAEERDYRTKRVASLIAQRLVDRGRGAEDALTAAVNILAAAKIKAETKADKKTKTPKVGGVPETGYLVFVGDDEVAALSDLADQNWDTLTAKKPDLSALHRPATAALERSSSVALALFGRMLAELPERNVEAVCQVAHAISTNRLAAEFDYFTAMDDLAGPDESGAAMVESLGFNSSCFYRYLTVDTAALAARLGADRARLALATLLDAVATAIPTGKQNSMAAHNPPELWLGVVRRSGHASLANAFLRPVSARAELDILGASAAALDTYWAEMTALYGTDGLTDVVVAARSDAGLATLRDRRVASFAAFSDRVVTAAFPPPGTSAA